MNSIFSVSADFGNLPLWIHAFSPLNLEDIKAMDGMSKRHPQVPVIIGHLGGIYWRETIELVRGNRNLYLDLSSAYTVIAPAMAVRELPERTLFSSDAPYGDPFLNRQMIERATPDKEVRKLVLGDTIARLIGL